MRQGEERTGFLEGDRVRVVSGDPISGTYRKTGEVVPLAGLPLLFSRLADGIRWSIRDITIVPRVSQGT
jgi:hypothetical protein